MRLILFIFQAVVVTTFYAQINIINIDSTTRAKINYEDFKYSPDFFINEEEREAIIVSYPNGQVTKSIFSTKEEYCCDSLVKYHPNGEISFIGKLFYWESVYDSFWEIDTEAIYYEAEMYYEDGKLAAKKYVSDSLVEYIVFNTDGIPFYQMVIVNGVMINGLKPLTIDDYWEEFEVIYNSLPVLYIKVNQLTNKIEDHKWLNDGRLFKDVTVDILKFDGWYRPNNIELFNLKADFYFKY